MGILIEVLRRILGSDELSIIQRADPQPQADVRHGILELQAKQLLLGPEDFDEATSTHPNESPPTLKK